MGYHLFMDQSGIDVDFGTVGFSIRFEPRV